MSAPPRSRSRFTVWVDRLVLWSFGLLIDLSVAVLKRIRPARPSGSPREERPQ